MRAKEFIIEANHRNIDLDGIISTIKRECAPFLRLTDVPMYRGMSIGMNKNTFFAKVPTLAFRNPRDTPAVFNNYIVAWFKDHFGFPFRQVHSMFATGALGVSDGYGLSFMVFPRGDFHFTWSPFIGDLTDRFSEGTKQFTADEIASQVDEVMDDGEYQFDQGLTQAIHSRNEITFICESYYILNVYDLRHFCNMQGLRYEDVIQRIFENTYYENQ